MPKIQLPETYSLVNKKKEGQRLKIYNSIKVAFLSTDKKEVKLFNLWCYFAFGGCCSAEKTEVINKNSCTIWPQSSV